MRQMVGEAVGAFVDNHKRFVLDKQNFSSIIYIWYEGAGLRPLIVNTLKQSAAAIRQSHPPSGENNGEEGKEGGEEEGQEALGRYRGGSHKLPHPFHQDRALAMGGAQQGAKDVGTGGPSARRQRPTLCSGRILPHNPT